MTSIVDGPDQDRRPSDSSLKQLASRLRGSLHWDSLHRGLYATDASVYRRRPHAVAVAADEDDLCELIRFASQHRIGLIPRGAGTSLAGQCVGDGMVVTLSRHFANVEFDPSNRIATVGPATVRDELNQILSPHGVFFSPNTSTANRCTIGGMVGNNSCGSTSIRYGCTRDKIVSVDAILSDGTRVTFDDIDPTQLTDKRRQQDLEGQIYRVLADELSPRSVHQSIRENFPDPRVKRRNTGYALDELIDCEPLGGGDGALNVGKLLAGSEGTLAFVSSIRLQTDSLPPPVTAMVIAHFMSIDDCLAAVEPAMEHPLFACEMLDKTILDLTANNARQKQNRELIEGDPAAILMMEVAAATRGETQSLADDLVRTLQKHSTAYRCITLWDEAIDRAVDLRKAGLGLLGNMVGDKKTVACIEDTAVPIHRLRPYIAEFSSLMRHADQTPVYYAHAGAGELHLRPVLNLKRSDDVRRFVEITDAVAALVKKYGGSMSGEHGDGIVRSKYIPAMIGRENYDIMRRIKTAFDPRGVFNPGKIVDPMPMDRNLRYEPDRSEPSIHTVMRFDESGGILRHAEKCNGSGDCLKSSRIGGVMCPSYRATRRESDVTRGRANLLREVLTQGGSEAAFDNEDLRRSLELCIGCKACQNECPSSVDVAAMKAEFLHQYHQHHRPSLRDRAFAHGDRLNRLARPLAGLFNRLLNQSLVEKTMRWGLGISQQRKMPRLSAITLRRWCRQNLARLQPERPIGQIELFVDEFSNQIDCEIGVDAIVLLTRLGYGVHVRPHRQSGRALISQGFLKHAKRCVDSNVATFANEVSEDRPLIGIEPSTTLTLRDEYLRLADDVAAAERLAGHTMLLDEFIAREADRGNISSSAFEQTSQRIHLHGHCHQKALSDVGHTASMLCLPVGNEVTVIAAGCCGMAGSFGYEKEHCEISLRMGEERLFPAVRDADTDAIIAATGLSCRQQIFDGTGRVALSPITILRRALRETPSG